MRLFLAGLALIAAPAAQADSFDCVITPAVTVQIGSPVSGLLDKVMVDQGSIVGPGDVIATLRSDVERKSVELMEIQANSTAEIEAQESRLALAHARLERARDMVARNVGTQEQLEAAEAEAEVIARERAIAELRREVAQLEWQRAEQQLEQRVIRSPIHGVVTARHLFSGEFLHTDARVVTIAQIDPLHVEAFLPVRLYRSVEPDMTLDVFTEPPVEGVFKAQVDVIDRVFDAASGTFGIRLTLPNPGFAIPAGHRCQLEIAVEGQ